MAGLSRNSITSLKSCFVTGFYNNFCDLSGAIKFFHTFDISYAVTVGSRKIGDYLGIM
jgi:hypothetical protein